uniref:Uncharacterized protein n=1 Tax=Oryza brachyantha TaxID=4533 RepID=J3LWD7_ORYBR
MKPGVLKSRRSNVGDEEEGSGGGGFPAAPRKECWLSLGILLKAVAALLIMMAGVLIGLAASASLSCYYVDGR